jgi:adenylate cyclase
MASRINSRDAIPTVCWRPWEKNTPLVLWNYGRMDSRDWEEAGLYQPEAANAAERKALLEYLVDRGATLQQMEETHRLGSLPGLAGDLALRPEAPLVSVEDLATRCGVSPERVRRVMLASGLPVGPGDTLPEDLDAVIAGFEQGSVLMGEDAILAFIRVLGAAASNIAEAAIALFYAELGPGTEREGTDELARARVSEAANRAFLAVPRVLSTLLLTQFRRASRRAALTRGWAAASHSAEEVVGAGSSSEIVALGFVDLVGSTVWAERLSLRDHSLALSRFESAAWSSAVLAGGRVVKMIGDEVFFAAPSADAACRIGTEVRDAAAADPILPPARGAIGYGGVTSREGDYFGPLVNLVSRLAKAAAPGELVVTEATATALPPDRWALRPLDLQSLRGLEHPVPAFAVSRVGT